MTVIASANFSRDAFPASLAHEIVEFSSNVASSGTPKEVLDRLHALTSTRLNLNVLGAVCLPRRVTDWESLRLGETVFLHDSAPKEWWEEWIRQVPHRLPVGFALAWSSLAPHTQTEALQMLQPIGVDRWGYDLALKYGARDSYMCPVGGRWLMAFWSTKVISKAFTQPVRILLFTAASFAVMRLDQLVASVAPSGTPRYALTPRELAVLRLLSIGTPFKEAAVNLGLGQETIRTHLKKVQLKLGVRNRAHAVAEAIRQKLIP
jgi:DNA-binding CsgD family transcriptional regulator